MKEPTIFDKYSSCYAATHDKYLPPGIRHDQFRIQKLEWVSSFPGVSLLDFGCNSGELCFDLLKLKPEMDLFGIDESVEAISIARDLANNSGSNINFAFNLNEISIEKKFDIITLFNVLHHVEEAKREALISTLIQLLNPGGKLLIWEHNPLNPVTRYLVKVCPFDAGVVLVKIKWLVPLLKQNKVNCYYLEYVNIVPPRWHKIVMFRWLESLLKRFPFGAQYRVAVTKKISFVFAASCSVWFSFHLAKVIL